MDLGSLHPTDDGSERRVMLGVLGLFLAIAVLAIGDIVVDLDEGTTLGHVAVEGVVVLVGVGGLWLGWRRMRELARAEQLAKAAAAELDERLLLVQAEATQWRAEARDLLRGLGAAIDRQLVRWQLTAAERDVALLLLKGFSHKEIAGHRRVGEATVRQQSRAIYHKAGVDGRHELAAFFLEDLVATRNDDATGPPPS